MTLIYRKFRLSQQAIETTHHLHTFANGLERNHAAVLNGLTLPYSSGAVEGKVAKIKFWKSSCSAEPTSTCSGRWPSGTEPRPLTVTTPDQVSQTLLSDTTSVTYGGQAEDAFDLVLPSLPGFGFSAAPASAGWDPARTARAWAELMSR